MTTLTNRLNAMRERAEAVTVYHLGGESYVAEDPAKLVASQADVPPLLEAVEAAYPIIRDMVDPDDCWFDHGGGCQAHGYLSLEPGETCPQYDAKKWLEELGGGDDER